MPLLTDAERDGLQVESFIFHGVHHGAEDPVLFDRTPIGEFEPFFIGRVVETLRGNRFEFEGASETLRELRAAEGGPDAFVAASKKLARQFHRDDGRFRRGILMVTTLVTGPRKLYSLIKYDHERVIAFDVIDANAALRAVVTGLTESPKALQKSALIELSDGGGHLVVLDRSKRTGITDFFRDFLGVRRSHGEDELTTAVVRTLIKTVRDHADALPTEITAHVKERLVRIAEQRPAFDADQFFGDYFGAHGSEAVRASFDRNFAGHGFDGESFTFDLASLPDDGPRKYRTKEGVNIVVPPAARSTFEIKPQPDGSAVIEIRTGNVTER